jgi:hypothetical protein
MQKQTYKIERIFDDGIKWKIVKGFACIHR